MSSEIEQLVAFIRDETGFAGAIDPDDDLLEAGVLDSFNIVSLAMFAQQRFGVEFDDEDLVREKLSRLANLVALIRARKLA